jgi:hypothetical protein
MTPRLIVGKGGSVYEQPQTPHAYPFKASPRPAGACNGTAPSGSPWRNHGRGSGRRGRRLGALAIGRLAVGRAVVRHLKVFDLEVKRLHVHELRVDQQTTAAQAETTSASKTDPNRRARTSRRMLGRAGPGHRCTRDLREGELPMAAFCLPIPVASRGVAAVLGLGGHEGWDPALT